MSDQGTATINFGAFPGSSDASVDVTGQASIVSGSLVEAWLRPVATGDHSADEHLVETIRVSAGNIIGATGFTIYAINTSQLSEPLTWGDQSANIVQDATQGLNTIVNGPPFRGGAGTRIYGQWTVAWVWA